MHGGKIQSWLNQNNVQLGYSPADSAQNQARPYSPKLPDLKVQNKRLFDGFLNFFLHFWNPQNFGHNKL